MQDSHVTESVRGPVILDLYCKAGGGAVGYHRAGFDLVGVDHRPQKRYPFAIVVADALDVLRRLIAGKHVCGFYLDNFAAIHASPPCQRFSIGTVCRGKNDHPDLLTPTLALLERTGKPWVVENVPFAPMGGYAAELCGLMFGLRVFRHRWFASSHLLMTPEHKSHKGRRIGENGMVCVAGHGGQSSGFGNRSRRVPADHRTKAAWSSAMDIDWMTRGELSQAIPPAYTEYLGKQLMEVVR